MATVHSRSELKWVRNSLWNRDEYLLAIVPHEDHKGMFWIKWPDGSQSDDFYNISRAKDNAVKYELGVLNGIVKKSPQEAAGAFK